MDAGAKITLIVLVALVLIGAGFWYLNNQPASSPTPTPIAVTLVTYDKPADGISFTYPSSYKLEEHVLDIMDMQGKYLTLIPADAVIPEAGEGPPGITIEILENPKKTPLADWLQTITNGTPAPSTGWDYDETTIGGEEAIAYTASGLYESDNVAVAHGSKVYVFSASWMTRDDQTLKDLEALLTSVRFLQ